MRDFHFFLNHGVIGLSSGLVLSSNMTNAGKVLSLCFFLVVYIVNVVNFLKNPEKEKVC